MDLEKQSLRVGAAVILCALVLRLAAGGMFTPVVRFFSQPNIASLLIYLETGRIVRFSDSSGPATVFVPASVTEPEETEPPTRPRSCGGPRSGRQPTVEVTAVRGMLFLCGQGPHGRGRLA